MNTIHYKEYNQNGIEMGGGACSEDSFEQIRTHRQGLGWSVVKTKTTDSRGETVITPSFRYVPTQAEIDAEIRHMNRRRL